MPRVSVVIPAYNAEPFLRDTIESALGQTFRDREVIVVNDGSTDATGEILERYKHQVRAIHQENQGQALARNRGISEGDSEFVALLDADDIWRPDKCERQIACADNRSHRVGLIHSDCRVIDEHGRPLSAFRRRPLRGDVLHHLLLYNPVAASTALVRRECFDRLGMFHPEPIGCEDWHMWIRIASEYEFAHIRELLCDYRVHPASTSHKPAVMCHASIRALDLVFADPAIVNRAGHLKNRAYARARLNCGIYYFRAGEMAEARRQLGAAARLSPAIVCEVAFVQAFVKSLLGRTVAQYLRSVKRLVGRIRSGRR